MFNRIKQSSIRRAFFEIYSKRAEIDKMLSFYADEFEYENIGFSSSTNDPKFLYEDFMDGRILQSSMKVRIRSQ